MVAIIEILKKQYLIMENAIIYSDLLKKKVGTRILFKKVLLCDEQIGTPYLKGITVNAIIEKHVKKKKIIIERYKPKKNTKRKLGFVPKCTRLKILKIEFLQSKKNSKDTKKSENKEINENLKIKKILKIKKTLLKNKRTLKK